MQLGYSVNSFSLESGEQLWKHLVEEPVYSMAVQNGIVYVIGRDMLYTLDEQSGAIKWQRAVHISRSSPEIRHVDSNSLVIVADGDVYLFNADTGDLKKSFYSGRGITETCIYQDRLYTFNNQVRAYMLESGALLWEDKTTYYTNKSVCEDGVAYFVRNDLEVVAYDLVSQAQLWSLSFKPAEPYTSDNLYIAQDFLIVEGLEANVIVSASYGELIYRIPERGHITATTVIENNLFVFYGHTQTIFSYDIRTWKNTGILRYSVPTFFSTDIEKFHKKGNQLILWKNKHLFDYE